MRSSKSVVIQVTFFFLLLSKSYSIFQPSPFCVSVPVNKRMLFSEIHLKCSSMVIYESIKIDSVLKHETHHQKLYIYMNRYLCVFVCVSLYV